MSPDRTRSAGNRRRSALCVGAALALVLPLAGCGSTDQNAEAAGGKAGGSVPAQPVVLRMLNPIDEWDSGDFVNEVEKVSNGRLRIEAVDHWHEDAADSDQREQAVFDAVRSGEAPLALTAVRAWHDQGIRSFDALIAPMQIDRPEVLSAVLHSDVAADMLAGLDGSGLTGIGILPGPIRYPAGITHPLVDVSDYHGATIATSPNAVDRKWLETLGAVQHPSMTWEGDFAGVDGVAIQASSMPANVTSMTVNAAVGPRPVVIYGSTPALADLSDENRQFLLDAAAATIDVKAATDKSRQAEDMGVLCRSGTVALDQADPAQLAALRAASEPVYQWLREDSATAGFLDRIQQVADATPVDPDDAPSCASESSASAAAASPGPLDGTYRSNITKEEAVANGDSTNWGETILVMDHGRFAHTAHNDQTCGWAYGRYTINGDTVTWDYEKGGGTGPINRPGEELGFHWSLYRDVLTLTNDPDAISPVPEGQQWPLNRISTTPDPSALNQQCPPPAAAFAN